MGLGENIFFENVIIRIMLKLVLKDQIEFGKSPLGIVGHEYWRKIVSDKHPEANLLFQDVTKTIQDPDRVYKSQHSQNVFLYTKKTSSRTTIATVKHVNDKQGNILTVYKTSDKKLNKEVIWRK